MGASTLAAAALSAGAMGVATSSAAHAGESAVEAAGKKFHRCPYGAVCIYPGKSWNGDRPSNVYFSYGSHKLFSQYGTHRIVNNQYGGATVSFCKGSNGTNCGQTMKGGYYGFRNLTPINSIKLTS